MSVNDNQYVNYEYVVNKYVTNNSKGEYRLRFRRLGWQDENKAMIAVGFIVKTLPYLDDGVLNLGIERYQPTQEDLLATDWYCAE